jgi:hypothetical protein
MRSLNSQGQGKALFCLREPDKKRNRGCSGMVRHSNITPAISRPSIVSEINSGDA